MSVVKIVFEDEAAYEHHVAELRAEWAAGRAERLLRCDGTPHPEGAIPPLAKHDYRFDGDDPYVVCARCGERRDALTGNVRAAGRAETTTATTEDVVEAAYRLAYDTMRHHPGIWHNSLRAAVEALADAGLLATARTRPTREQIAKVLARHDGKPVATTTDAVLALLADQPDPADIAAKARADLLAYLIDDFNRQHALVALDTPEEGYSGLSWHEWADGTRNGMEKLIYTVRYLAEHPEYAERAARLRGGAR